MQSGGQVLRSIRRGAGLTQQAIVDQLGVSSGLVSQWERGIVTPRRSNAEELDELLGADGRIMRAFGYADNDVTPRDDPPAGPQEQIGELRALVADLSERVAAQGVTIERLSGQLDRLTRGRSATRRGSG